MFGYTAEEAIGHSIAIIIPPDRLHEETEILARLQRGEKTEHFETERIHKSGRVVAVSVNVSPVRDSRGRVIGASKVART
jgi:PAS domain S-box-containing protein